MPEQFLWDLATLVNARQGDRVTEGAWLILCLQDLVYNCNNVSAIEALNAYLLEGIILSINTQTNDTSTACMRTKSAQLDKDTDKD